MPKLIAATEKRRRMSLHDFTLHISFKSLRWVSAECEDIPHSPQSLFSFPLKNLNCHYQQAMAGFSVINNSLALTTHYHQSPFYIILSFIERSFCFWYLTVL